MWGGEGLAYLTILVSMFHAKTDFTAFNVALSKRLRKYAKVLY